MPLNELDRVIIKEVTDDFLREFLSSWNGGPPVGMSLADRCYLAGKVAGQEETLVEVKDEIDFLYFMRGSE